MKKLPFNTLFAPKEGYVHFVALAIVFLSFAFVLYSVVKNPRILGDTTPATSPCTTVGCSPSPTPTPTPTSSPKVITTPISWKTNSAAVSASNFYIIANGKRYGTSMKNLVVAGDPGRSDYTNIDASWTEKGVTMRVVFYFRTDGKRWYVSEARTYNGGKNPEWIYYKGFKGSALGDALTRNNTVVTGDSSSNKYSGKIYLKDLSMLPTFNTLTSSVANISASSNPCVVAKGQKQCSSKITYSFTNVQSAQLCVQAGKSKHIPLSAGVSGTTYEAPWIVPGYKYNFTLRTPVNNCEGSVIANLVVTGKKK